MGDPCVQKNNTVTICILRPLHFREDLKKVTDQGGGGVNQNSSFFGKRKRCRMFWNGKMCTYSEKNCEICSFVLCFKTEYESFDMHIEKG